MNRQFKRIALAATIAAVSGLQTIPAHACGGRSGGGGGFGISIGGRGHSGGIFGGTFSGGGYGHAASAPVHRVPAQQVQSYPSYPSAQPIPAPSVHMQPTYSQPGYASSMPSQPHYAQPNYAQPALSQPSYTQPTYSQPGVGTSPSIQQAHHVQSQTVGQPSGVANPVSHAGSNPNVANVRPVTQATSQAPAQQRVASPRMAQSAPAAAAVQAAPAANSASQPSALEMLASITLDEVSTESVEATVAEIPEFTAAATSMSQVEAHVGIWSVTLPGNQSVTLELGADGNFKWTATKDGKSSNFDGQFRLEGERLTLVRSQDLQQMAGNWSGADGNFTFKLDGATNSGLAFARQ